MGGEHLSNLYHMQGKDATEKKECQLLRIIREGKRDKQTSGFNCFQMAREAPVFLLGAEGIRGNLSRLGCNVLGLENQR